MGVNHFSGSRGSHVDGQRFPALRFVRELRDEICEPRPSRWECSPFITGSALGESSVPQNLGVGQKECPTATPGGRGDGDGIPEETICKVAYQFGRSLLCDDKGGIASELVDAHSGMNWPKIVCEGGTKRDDQASTHWSWARSCGGYPSYRAKRTPTQHMRLS